MKGIVKKLISTIAAAALALTVVTLPAAPGSVAEAAFSASAEGGCDSNHEGMTAWAGEEFTTNGSYFLEGDVTLADEVLITNCTATLCLNGHTITAANGKRIFRMKDCTFTLCDCQGRGKLTGGNPTDGSGGGAIFMDNAYAKFNMYGGTITGNRAPKGGAVFITEYGTFNMYGGTISGNTASGNGGAVCLGQRGKFVMTGGTISDNTASDRGGGVYVPNKCEFTMSGGTIEKNKADFNGGGVYVGGSNVYEGTFKMTGGTISGNETTANGGGVFVDTGGAFTMSGGTIFGNKARTDGGGVCFSAGKFTIDGKVDISGNTKTGNSSANNVYLYRNKTITIESGFDTDNPIGVNTHTAPTSCSSPVAVAGSASDISSSFTADIDGQSIDYKDGQVQLLGAHNWGEWETTTAPTATEKGVETRTCNNDGTHTETREIPATGGGNTGDNGDSGNTGDNGNSGNTGDNGDNGNTGDNGDNGNTGDNGGSGNSGGSSGGSSSDSSTSGSSENSGSSSESNTKTPSFADVEQDEKSPETELASSDSELKDALLTEEELENADNITIVLRVKDEDPGEDRQTIETRLASTDGFKVGQYIDVSLFKIINGSETKLTNVNKPIKVRFEIPQELRADGRTFAVIRVHDGKTTILADIDGDRDTITIETDKFSTYALIYSDSPTAGNPYTGTTSAIFPTALLAAAAMLISKRRK